MTKTGWRGWLDGLTRNLPGKRRRRAAGFIPAGRRPYRRLELEYLEVRLAPAFDLLVNATGATAGVTATVSGTTTTFTATATGAHLNVNDIVTALSTGDVVVDSGATGTEAGDITINAGVTQPVANGAALTFQTGSGAGVVGNIAINGNFSSAGGGDAFPLKFLALNNLVLNGNLNSGGDVALTATNGAISQTGGLVQNISNLSLTAGTGIGSAATPLALSGITNVQALDGTGGVFLNSDGVNIGFGGATPGIQVTGSGDISVLGNTLSASNAVEGPGSIILESTLSAGLGGSLNLTAAAPVTSTGGAGTSINLGGDSVTIASAVSDAGGAVSVFANDLTFTGTVSTGASSGVVTLQQFSTTTRNIDLGGGTTAGYLDLSDAELGFVTAGVLRIGRTDNAGSIVITGPVATHTGFNTLDLLSGGLAGVGEAGTGTISVTNLAVQSLHGDGLGRNTNAVSNIAVSDAGGVFILLNSLSLTVTTVDGVMGIDASGGASLQSSVANTALTVSQPVVVGAFTAFFTFDNMALNAAVLAPTAQVQLTPFSAGQLIDLGGADAAGTLGFTNAELSEVTANVLVIGFFTAGNITVGDAVTLTAEPTLILETGGGIVEGGGGSLAVANLVLLAAAGVGDAGRPSPWSARSTSPSPTGPPAPCGSAALGR